MRKYYQKLIGSPAQQSAGSSQSTPQPQTLGPAQ
jgi:hypothetical protein